MVKDIIGIGTITITDLNDASISTNPPKNPSTGDIWIDSSGDKNVLKQYTGTEWINASLDVTELDKDLSDKITTIENTLGNIGNDGKLTYDERVILVEELNLIVGEQLSTSKTNKYPTAMPDYTLVDSNASGSFANYRKAAKEVGIRGDNSVYNDLQKTYTTVTGFLGRQGTPRPWDITKTNKAKATTLTDPDEFRQVILDYYLAELALVTETKDRAHDLATSDTISEDSGATPMIVLPTQEGGALQVGVEGFYKSEPEPNPKGYALEIRTQKAVETEDGYVGEGEKEHVLVPMPKVILEGESLILDEDKKWKIETPTEKIVLTKKAQKALNNVVSFRKATVLTLADTHNLVLEVKVHVKAKSASWYRDQQAKDYTDDAMSNVGSALDVEVSGPYEIPPLSVGRITEYTLEALVYWRGKSNSGVLGRKTPAFSWDLHPVEHTTEEDNVETRGVINFSPVSSYSIDTESNTEEFYVSLGRWVSLTATYDGETTKLFVNGKLAASKSGGSAINLDELMIGEAANGTLDGYISNVRIWDKALSDKDVDRYQRRRLRGDEPGLVLYYRLNGGNRITDSGPNENHIEPDESIGWVDDSEALKDLDSEIEVVSTKVTQLADSWVLNIHNNNDLVTQINASDEGIRLKANKVTIDINTPIDGDSREDVGGLLDDLDSRATKEEVEAIELTPGPSGKTAYQIAKEEGFVGTESEWIQSLIGDKGDSGETAYEVALKEGFEGTQEEWLNSLKGPKGARGPQGTKGPAGANGQSQWTHIRYSANASGSSMTDKPASTTKYIGIAITSSKSAPTYTGFTWSKYAGDDGKDGATGAKGPQGVKGSPGSDGKPTYTWVRYADTPTSGMSNFPEDKKYIGMAFNQTSKTESSTYSHYEWSLMPQNIEIGGRNLLPNTNREDEPGSREYMSLPYDLTPVFEEHGLDQEYTMSFDLKSKDISNYDSIILYPKPGSTYPNRHKFPQKSFKVTTEYQRFSMTFKPTDGNKDKTTTHISVYGSYDTGNFPMLRNIKLEKGNTATDWTPAPEDVDDAINDKADNDRVDKVEDDLTGYVPVDGYEEDIGELNSTLNQYKSELEAGEIAQEQAASDISDLINTTVGLEQNLGEFTSKWNFLETSITMGDDGLLIGDEGANTGIRIGTERIDFIDRGTIVAEITGRQMKINRGIFVQSATIGEHLIETKNGHTVWQWVK